MYHHGEDRIRAVVNIIDNTVSFSYSSNPHELEVIKQDLYEMKNGKLMSLKLNYEKTLFQKAKQMLMKELANKTSPIRSTKKNAKFTL
jgi:RNA polymerase-interacting CarD/CdnL/TRCF family regulator